MKKFIVLTAIICASIAVACSQQQDPPAPPMAGLPDLSIPVGPVPGPQKTTALPKDPYIGDPVATQEGRQLFVWFNCAGCHSNGGGGMGPPLMDDEWLYGSLPNQIFASIAEGRANGMPSWKYKPTNDQIWQLVAYVRSLSGLTPKSPRPGRNDHMMVKPAPNQTPNAKPKNTGLPGASTRP